MVEGIPGRNEQGAEPAGCGLLQQDDRHSDCERHRACGYAVPLGSASGWYETKLSFLENDVF